MMTVSAWKSREYRRVWAAGAVAGLGGEIGDLALPVLALTTLGASAQEMSWVKAALYLPYLLLTLWLGVLVDRHRRRPLMIGAELSSFVVLLTVAVLALVGWLSIPMLVAATFLLGAASVLHTLAWNLGNEAFILALTVAVIGGRPDGPLALGLVLMAGGVGAFVGAGLSARLTARFGYGRSLIGALLLGNTAPLLGMWFARDTATGSLAIVAVAFLGSGLGIGVANSQAVTVRQLAVPDDLRGRVNAAYRLLSWGALSVGALLAGVAVSLLGTWQAGVLGAAVMALSSVPVIASPVRRMRGLDVADET